MASILLIHSDAIVSDCICRAIVANETETSLVVAGAVRTLAEGREFMSHRVPDLVAVDLRVSDGPFAPWFNYFRLHRPRPRIVVIAGAVQDPPLLDALRRGADGYAIATHGPVPLVGVLEQVLSGRSMMAPEIARRLQLHFAQQEAIGRAPIDDEDRQLLRWVSTGYGLDDIAQGLHTTPGRLGVQVRGLYAKLELDDGPDGPRPLHPR
jgi:DNA-binding NarL/FixJ family response regulator